MNNDDLQAWNTLLSDIEWDTIECIVRDELKYFYWTQIDDAMAMIKRCRSLE